MPPEICPACGAIVPEGAPACPECGSDEETGWSESAQADALGIPGDSFDYQRFVREEFEGAEPKRPFGKIWAIVALALIVAFSWWLVAALF